MHLEQLTVEVQIWRENCATPIHKSKSSAQHHGLNKRIWTHRRPKERSSRRACLLRKESRAGKEFLSTTIGSIFAFLLTQDSAPQGRIPTDGQMSDYICGICQRVKKSGGPVSGKDIPFAHPPNGKNMTNLVDYRPFKHPSSRAYRIWDGTSTAMN
jgi:hypothetical protein